MKNYVKIMREMLKRRQFIFGKQNINRHQPYVDDVVINISDEDTVMKFAPTKRQVIDVFTGGNLGGAVYNISENDVEFVDTFIYYATVGDGGNGPSASAYHVGYMYRIIGGTITFPGGEVEQLANPNSIALFPGPILIHESRLAKLNITTEAVDFAEYFPYSSHNTHFHPIGTEFALQLGNDLTVVAMVLGFDIEATEDESLISEDILPRLGDTVEVTSDTVKYIEHKVQIGVFGEIIK